MPVQPIDVAQAFIIEKRKENVKADAHVRSLKITNCNGSNTELRELSPVIRLFFVSLQWADIVAAMKGNCYKLQ